jgi:iron complex outermembrane receptor protein
MRIGIASVNAPQHTYRMPEDVAQPPMSSARSRSRPSPVRSWRCLPPAIALVAGTVVVSAPAAWAEDGPSQRPDPSAADETASYKQLSLEQLMDIEVTTVSRRPERLILAPSAIQVVTGDDIKRSGASTLPQALRLAPNLQVAQVNASQWAISARGFNNVLANKLLVMIDGRTVYTPLYSGVFWDAQNVLLEDVERIEVVSGPGGAVWGANAVNGVINVITKSADETQGLYVEGAAGTALSGYGALRYGGRLNSELSFRVYGMGFRQDSTVRVDGSSAGDDWTMDQGGFRVDWQPRSDNHVTLQGDFYDGRPDPDAGPPVGASGGNALGRMQHVFSEDADCQLQAYYDQSWRDFGNGFKEYLQTYDVDWQHHFRFAQRHDVLWGLGYRRMDDEEHNLPLFAFTPAHQSLNLYSAFVQDDVAIVRDVLRLTLGSKFERNDFTGFEPQPSARVAWSPHVEHTIWAAASRAVRTPSRLERDFSLSAAPGVAILAGNDDFMSEKVHAYELGWRAQPERNLSFSLSTFYNDYFDLRSAEPGPPPFGIPIRIGNGVEGHTYGAEVSADSRLVDGWHLRGGYTFLKKKLWIVDGSHDLNGATAESDDPEHQFLLQSTLDLPHAFQLDTVARYVTELHVRNVPGYVGLDVRLAWNGIRGLELSLVGQNLLDRSHPEFAASAAAPQEIERSVYGKIAWRY